MRCQVSTGKETERAKGTDFLESVDEVSSSAGKEMERVRGTHELEHIDKGSSEHR
jgi:hypothetical protein